MNHRHLLPTEIDLLLDDEEGFGVAPLKAHVRDCAECRAQLDEARFVTESLERLPHLAPHHDFVDQVMARVSVYQPWHVAARDAVQRWVPRSRPARVTAIALASAVGSVLTVAILWIAAQSDLLVFATGVAGSQAREIIAGVIRALVTSLFGTEAFTAMQQLGPTALLLILFAFLVAAFGAGFGLRAIATASSRRA